jgi:drug/metabolite transporter (DMT)-like permease
VTYTRWLVRIDRDRFVFALISVAGFVGLTVAGFVTGGVGLGIVCMLCAGGGVLVARFWLRKAGLLDRR